MKRKLVSVSLSLALMCAVTGNAQSPAPSGKKLNSVMTWGDDIGRCDVIDQMLTVPAVASLDAP